MEDFTYIIAFLVICAICLYFYNYYNDELLERYLSPAETPAEFECDITPKDSQVQDGLKYLKTKKVIIAGLMRDSEYSIETLKANVVKLSDIFDDYRLLVVENNSEDDTRLELLKWSGENSKVKVLGCGVNAPVCDLNLPKTILHNANTKRIQKMVTLRNIYMDYIEENSTLFSDYEYLIVIDFDIQGTFYKEGVGSSGHIFKTRPDIQSICSNGYRVIHFGPVNWIRYFDQYAHLDLQQNDRTAMYRCTDDKEKLISCFNGFTIYKLKSVLKNKYKLKEHDGAAICEHVTFNEQLEHMFINPQMIFVIVNNK